MSVISAIRQRFSIGQQHSSSFSSQQGAASKTSLGNSVGEGADEVYYSALNDADAGFDTSMLEDSLEYEAYKAMEESDRENNK